MNPEKTQKIMDAYPRLYRGKSKPLHESLMSWGFTCGDGWYDLVWNLSQAIEEASRQEGLDPQSESWPEAVQVKEKFGTLRFHLKHASDRMRQLIGDASEASAHTCEVCGLTGSLFVDGRCSKTVCPEHSK